jgi:hypothetical protein
MRKSYKTGGITGIFRLAVRSLVVTWAISMLTVMSVNSIAGEIATGGIEYEFNGYMTHTFINDGELVIHQDVDVEVLVVGGGGGGGSFRGGGGGGSATGQNKPGTGGLGGGGAGVAGNNKSTPGEDGEDGTGGGGGGGGTYGNSHHAGGKGGSGIVIIRYLAPRATVLIVR